ncbi:MAG TPA: hypothetical protein PLO43_05590, partial [Chlamydiales bacterium]|nr:hypothetical protein [Chlamydiales bacterium]
SRHILSVDCPAPDPLQQNPPKGERLVINWRLPQHAMGPSLTLKLNLILKDYTQLTKTFPIDKRFGYITYDLLDEEYRQSGGLLTYKAEIETEGAILETYEQVLWTELIDPPYIDYDGI